MKAEFNEHLTIESRKQLVRKILNYVRYHHFNTHPGKKSHAKFISILTKIEDKGRFSIDDRDVDDSWFFIKMTMSKFFDEELIALVKEIDTKQ